MTRYKVNVSLPKEDTMDRPRIDKITIRWEPDPEPVMHDPGDCDACDAGYEPEGCTAVAEISYSIGGNNRRLETFMSGGLWGICTTSGDDPYRREVEDEELADLREHLTRFGVDVSDFDAKVQR